MQNNGAERLENWASVEPATAMKFLDQEAKSTAIAAPHRRLLQENVLSLDYAAGTGDEE